MQAQRLRSGVSNFAEGAHLLHDTLLEDRTNPPIYPFIKVGAITKDKYTGRLYFHCSCRRLGCSYNRGRPLILPLRSLRRSWLAAEETNLECASQAALVLSIDCVGSVRIKDSEARM